VFHPRASSCTSSFSLGKKVENRRIQNNIFEAKGVTLFKFGEFPIVDCLALARLLNTVDHSSPLVNALAFPDVVMRGFLCLSYRLPTMIEDYAKGTAVPSFPPEAWDFVQLPFIHLMNVKGPTYCVFRKSLEPYLTLWANSRTILRVAAPHPLRNALHTVLSTGLPFFQQEMQEGTLKWFDTIIVAYDPFVQSFDEIHCSPEFV
jgi:hypothetical protein